MSLPFPVSLTLENVIESIVRLDPDTQRRLAGIEGKTIRINVQNPTLSVQLCIVDGSVCIINNNDDPADTTISGTLTALKSLSHSSDALYRRDVLIEGDLGLGQKLREILAGLDPDWQDALSPVLGDALTHRLDRAQQRVNRWLKRTARSTQQNTSEFLQEEIELVAPASQVQRFCNEVDELRAAADRLEARIRLFEQQRQTSDHDGLGS